MLINKPTWTDAQFVAAVAQSRTVSAVLRLLGLQPRGGNYKTFHKHVKRLGLSLDHFDGSYIAPACNKGRSLSEILVENSDCCITSRIKRRMVDEGLVQYVCAVCGLDSWCGKKITLHVDHVNGRNRDNRLENLRLLCPNCHSQTATYTGRNIKKRRAPRYCVDCRTAVRKKSTRCASCLYKKRVSWRREKHRTALVCERCGAALYAHQKRFCSNVCRSIGNRKVLRPSKATLRIDVDKLSWCATGRKYGVSDNAVRKWAKAYGLV